MKKLFLLAVLFSASFSFAQTEAVIVPASSTQAIPQEDNTIYTKTRVEVHPEFPKGIEKFYAFVAENYKMPKEGLEGKLFVVFIVEKDGSLTDISILKDIGFDTGKEAIRVLKLSPKWKPAELNGKKVRCSYSLPILLPNPREVIYVK